jgi:pilus assembly protein CpaB
MNSRAFTLSIIIAGIAMFMAWSYMETKESEFVQKYGNTLPVVVAKVDIDELELIDDSKVQTINVPEKFRMPGHIKTMEEVYNTIATVPIKAGEQITKPRLTHPGTRTGLSTQVSIGKRGYAVNVTASSAVGKLIKPGDRVDVLARISYAPGQLDKMKVKTVLQDILVLSTGVSITNSLPMVAVERDNDVRKMKLNTYTDFNTVSLELSPYEVQKMIFLVDSGSRIYLSLRNNDDKKVERLPSTMLYDVLGEDAVEAKRYYQNRERRENARRGN